MDTVVFRCECGNKIHSQTEAGECKLAKYQARSVPLSIAGGLDGLSTRCDNCGKHWRIVAEVRRVRLRLRKLR